MRATRTADARPGAPRLVAASTRVDPRGSLRTKLLAFVVGAVLITVAVASAMEVRARTMLQEQVYREQASRVHAFASLVGVYLGGSRGAVESAAQVADVRAPLDLGAIRPALRGVPRETDPDRRAALGDMVRALPRFAYAFQLGANGDMYILEPFERQLTLTRGHFAFRDYYRRVVATGATAWSDVYVSATTGRPVVTVATPIAADNGDLQSVAVRALSLETLAQAAQADRPGQTGAMLLFDSRGVPVVYPDPGLVGARQLAAASGQILAAVAQQAAGSAQRIAASVRQHATGMDQIAGAMGAINDASAHGVEATTSTRQAADNLTGLAAHLNQVVDQYWV